MLNHWKGMSMRERPWCVEFKNLMKNSLFVPFSARRSKVFWRGQMRPSANERGGLIRCKTVILPKNKFEIDHRWSGIMGVGNKKTAIIKTISENVFCGIRLGGMGIAIGSAVGNELANKI